MLDGRVEQQRGDALPPLVRRDDEAHHGADPRIAFPGHLEELGRF